MVYSINIDLFSINGMYIIVHTPDLTVEYSVKHCTSTYVVYNT